jgi:hypothetical protein
VRGGPGAVSKIGLLTSEGGVTRPAADRGGPALKRDARSSLLRSWLAIARLPEAVRCPYVADRDWPSLVLSNRFFPRDWLAPSSSSILNTLVARNIQGSTVHPRGSKKD